MNEYRKVVLQRRHHQGIPLRPIDHAPAVLRRIILPVVLKILPYLCELMSTPRTVAFHTLGCKLNYAESSGLQRLFEREGYTTVGFDQGASIYVINTCSVTDFADRKCRHIVRRALKTSPGALVVVTGCYAQLKPEEIASIPGVDLVLGAAEKFRILEFIGGIDKGIGKGMVRAGEIREAAHFVSSFSFGDRTRSFLKVQDGCDYKCSFCTIPMARGKSRSDTIEQVLDNARQIEALGIKEIVLTGVNLGDFGHGTAVIEGVTPRKEALFADLVQALDRHTLIPRYRISSIEPNLLTDEIIHMVAESKRFMPHFHIPLQSGSDRILSLMRRRYRRDLYARRVEAIRAVMPHACIGVDVIVGFPGEMKSDFMETCHFLEDLDISYLHVFTYSERPGTPAAEWPDVVPVAERRSRNLILSQLSEMKRRFFYAAFAGTDRPVLFEKDSDPHYMSGYTDNYIRIRAPFQADWINTIRTVSLEDLLPDGPMRVSLPAVTV